MKIYLGTDHAGFTLKEAVKEHLIANGYRVDDLGAVNYDPEDDYPDFVFPVAEAVARDPEGVGIIFGGSGQGEAMAANRVPGVRAVVFYDGPDEIVKLSRWHNNANILSLGARFIPTNRALQVIDLWLKEQFDGNRHQRRIDKLDKLS
ncbi:MAG: RpiB/LacA/LacB family sugar-phosphate isomerase [Candidatus Marinimicrobia bacterium]|nr:RpiB/LacA/LacB family sugar-phosphate isomerase [Candidatus Neomarinimicrobiota bacterium]